MSTMSDKRKERLEWMVKNPEYWPDFPTTKHEVMNNQFWSAKNWVIVYVWKKLGLISKKTWHQDVNVADLANKARKIMREKLVEHDIGC